MQLRPLLIAPRPKPKQPKRLALLYHELRKEPSAYSYALSLDRFEEHLNLLAEMEHATRHIQPVITFDDGHLSDFEYAMPALARANRQGYFFITAGWTGNRVGYMGPDHLRTLHQAGHVIGAHGWSHALLPRCTPAELKRELEDARSRLEDILSAPVTNISLPGGRGNKSVMSACQAAGYTTVWTSLPGLSQPEWERTVGRFNILATHTTGYLRRLLDPDSGVLRREVLKSRVKMAGQRLMGDSLYTRLWSILNHQEKADPSLAKERSGR